MNGIDKFLSGVQEEKIEITNSQIDRIQFYLGDAEKTTKIGLWGVFHGHVDRLWINCGRVNHK